MDFPIYILGIIIPTDELIFFRGVAQPPTRYGYTLTDMSLLCGTRVTLCICVCTLRRSIGNATFASEYMYLDMTLQLS